MGHPKLGMHYEDVRKKLKGPLGKDVRIRDSLLNQARLHEGDGAVKEITKEMTSSQKAFSGAGNKQISNWGSKCTPGKWTW